MSIGGAQAAPPIACAKAATAVERTICASPEFRAMDREIAALTDRAMLAGEDRARIVSGEQAFLRRRTGCAWAAHNSAHPGVAVEECVRGAMDARVAALRDAADGKLASRSR